MILAYRVFTTFLYPFLFIFIYYRKILKKEDPKRFKEKILVSHYRINKKDKSKLIWFHAASIGEFKSIIPIISQLNIKNRNLKFLVTTTTLSSGNLAQIELKKFSNAEHRYLPLDVPFLIDKFLTLWKPNKIFLVESEIWPNLILKTKQYKIPIALINARLTSNSFNKWMMFPNTAKKIFGIFDLCLCSNVETKNYLKILKLKNIYFKGNIKLIDPVNEGKINNVNAHFLKKKRFWFAASIHKEEDIYCLKTHIKLKETFKDLYTIIAPRHIERTQEIETLSRRLNLNVQVLNKNETISGNKEIIIINYFGALQSFYKFAKSVFIGKSMTKNFIYNGGQNPIEAAKLKCKIYHGPYVYNFAEIYKILEKNKISKQIKSHEDLHNHLFQDLKQPNKKNNQIPEPVKSLGQKTLNNTMELIDVFINDSA